MHKKVILAHSPITATCIEAVVHILSQLDALFCWILVQIWLESPGKLPADLQGLDTSQSHSKTSICGRQTCVFQWMKQKVRRSFREESQPSFIVLLPSFLYLWPWGSPGSLFSDICLSAPLVVACEVCGAASWAKFCEKGSPEYLLGRCLLPVWIGVLICWVRGFLSSPSHKLGLREVFAVNLR